MIIEVFGRGFKAGRLNSRVRSTMDKLGMEEIPIERIEEDVDILARGIMDTPALVINGDVMCQGEVPKKEVIERWLSFE